MSVGWFRSWHGAPTDQKWLGIARRAKVSVSVVVATMWALLDDASQNTDRGSTQHFSTEDFAAFLGIDESDVRRVVETLRERAIITADGRLANWQKRQVFRERPEDLSTDRVRDFRKRHGTPGNTPPDHETPVKRHETPSASMETPPDTDSEYREEIRGDSPLNPPNESSLRSDSLGRRAKRRAPRSSPKEELRRVLDNEHADAVVAHRTAIKRRLTSHGAKLLAQKFAACPDPNAAADFMIERGWQGFDREWLENAQATGPPGVTRLHRKSQEGMNDAFDRYRDRASARGKAVS